jgi:hypothetical protein
MFASIILSILSKYSKKSFKSEKTSGASCGNLELGLGGGVGGWPDPVKRLNSVVIFSLFLQITRALQRPLESPDYGRGSLCKAVLQTSGQEGSFLFYLIK